MSGMFGGGTTNSYDDIVAKTTDENLTTENWELILNLCDKVADEGAEGAHNVIAATLKRLAHRNPNVQLYTLSLVEALSKNCGLEVHKEIASRAFTQGLEKLVTDRNTHEKVSRKTLELITMWTAEFENDPQLGVMEDCFNNLKAKNYKYEPPNEVPPPAVDDEIRRKEEEELQRVLEMSMTDKGGRGQWDIYGPSGSSSGGGSGVGSSSNLASGSGAGTGAGSSSTAPYSGYGGGSGPGYVPAPERKSSLPTPAGYTSTSGSSSSHGHGSVGAATTATATSATTRRASTPMVSENPIVTRVRALHTFEPSEAGELGFQKGDIIKVVDRGYKDWWRGQLKGRTGIFPVNYVEPMPEPTASELAREAEQEAAVFAQAVNVEKLLNMLKALDPQHDNLADNEEIQELYRSSMALRPKIVKLIDKYSQKRADLVSMNETFVRARTIFDQMMEESLARHTGGYDPAYRPPTAGPYIDPRSHPDYGTSPTPAPAGYGPGPGSAGPWGAPQGYPHFPQAQTPGVAPPSAYPGGGGGAPNFVQQQQQQQQQPYGQPAVQYGPQPYGVQQSGPVSGAQHGQPEPQVQQQIQQQQQVQQQQQQPQPQQQPQQQPADTNAGPPYVYDPNGIYADPNVQAWAQYYAQGGKDPTGSVYFLSVPGIKEGPQSQQPQPVAAQSHQNGMVVTGGSGGAGVDQDHGQGHQQAHQIYQQQSMGMSPTSSTFNPQHQQQQASGSVESLPYPGPASSTRSDSLPYPGPVSSVRSDSLPYPGPVSSARLDSLPYPGPVSDRSDSLPYPGPASPPHNASTSSLGTYGTTPYGAPIPGAQPPQSVLPAYQQTVDHRSSTGSLTTVGGPGGPGPADPIGAGGGVFDPAASATSAVSHSPSSPSLASSTPSWVLPKVEPSSRFGGSGGGGGFSGLQSQMSGLNLGPSGGHGQTSQTPGTVA
ncbi:hypothetical protein E1B28_006944 [Marasmius oreades]|uniref:Class E vacuolar protein-sorting machinery protein HSE1 n=1 Tax=Marasmius oreades TaxID=181124 RepID=A0A9P7S201_9AGAR|nr:uncharacterized protein E1B28_006944 [Marasmius oreades]KAG7093261.1 hypothetical protein E1B28_006944 [Marasmius oreades]